MHQMRRIGGGIAEDKNYETWEVKECVCGRIVKESYSCTVISKKEALRLEAEMDPEIVPEPESV